MNKNIIKILGLVVLAVASRFLPHPPNFSPVAAISLLGGAYILNRHLALALPIFVLFLSDCFLGFYPGMIFNYLGMVLMVFLGQHLSSNITFTRVGAYSVAGSTLFFVISNFGVWFSQTLYPLNLSGLITCYVNAIPFYGYSLLGDLSYGLVLFGLASKVLIPSRSVA